MGHQAIGAAFGGNIIKAPKIFHGKTSNIDHYGSLIFDQIESSYKVVRYHSLIIEKKTLPNELKITATLSDDEEIIMAVEHVEKPIYGVQFHPESLVRDRVTYGKMPRISVKNEHCKVKLFFQCYLLNVAVWKHIKFTKYACDISET